MKPTTVVLLRSPVTHEPLGLLHELGPSGSQQAILVSTPSGERFPIHEGIPRLLDEAKVAGFNRRYQRFYNTIARCYDPAIKVLAYLTGGREARYRQEYLQAVEIQAGNRVLEVSIGTGANLRYLPMEAQYFGVDISWGMLRQCQRNLRKWQREAELLLGNAEALPLQDQTFDAVFHVGGINVFDDRAAALREMIRVAKAGTKVVIVDETVKLVEALTWIPGVRRLLEVYRDRFSPPVALVPTDMRDLQVKEIMGGKLYCLTFRKP